MSYICDTCGAKTEGKKITKGSIWIELILWCTLMFGWIYSIWRLASRYTGCTKCGSSALVPLGSPKGKAMVDENDRTLNQRKCPVCGEVIQKTAALCKHCRSTVLPIYSDDTSINAIVITVAKLKNEGQSSRDIANQLNDTGVENAISFGLWDEAKIDDLIKSFRI